jgi:putative ABC transport system substrate-binding protein
MRRRQFITLLGGAVVFSPAAQAQRPAMPAIGILHAGSPEANADTMAALRQGLAEGGYVEGRNVAIEYRWAHGEIGRLPQLALDLVQRRVAVIVTPGYLAAAFAAKAATSTIPIVFNTGADPVEAGLVASLNRPGGDVTGVSFMNTQLGPKRLGMLHEWLPKTARFALLVNRSSPITDAVVTEFRQAAASIGRNIEVITVTNGDDVVSAVAALVQKGAEAFLMNPDQLFYDRRVQLITLAARYRLPTVYPAREWSEAGGLMSYGSSYAEQHRQAGIYVGRILKGDKPADLPILRATKFELVINLQTARALDINVPPTLLALADEVIE